MNCVTFFDQLTEDVVSFNNLFGTFLEDFYRADKDKQGEMVKEEPKSFNEIPARYYSILAATVHRLCRLHNIEVPRWVFHTKYTLDQPYFSMDTTGELRLVFLIESPIEFKARNIFVESNVLSRA